ncbi:MAG: T9SS type A sorting domain-containing protein [Candidatus Delongbacteria bacterium]|jgi:tetratricopeptide (TPR) repeat protein|nr:T9SS type A sorting domain-containing protein [Candidatus Delongbacteria bacterium]
MKFRKLLVVLIVFCFIRVQAEILNANPDPDGDPWYAGGYLFDEEEEEFLSSLPRLVIKDEVREKELPPSWDNMDLPDGLPQCFRPVFNQQDYSCAQAAMIGYVFTFEVNRKNYTSADIEKRQYPSHFTYNFINNGSSTSPSSFSQAIDVGSEFGIPNSEIWREVTSDPMAGEIGIWMSGYDKYYDALKNKITKIPGSENGGFVIENNRTEESLETLKYYLRYHNIEDAIIGGVVGCSTNIFGAEYTNLGTILDPVPYMISPATHGGHAMTIAGYDDIIAYDFDIEYKSLSPGPFEQPLPPSNYEWDRVVGDWSTTPKPMVEWEVGALKVVNSWGEGYPASIGGGYTYIPYRFLNKLGTYFTGIEVETNYKPEVTYKVEMQHHNRNTFTTNIKLESGDYTENHTFTSFGGDAIGYNGNFPMRGPDNYEPIEFCLDISQFYTDTQAPKFTPSVYSFIIDDQRAGDTPVNFTPMVLNYELMDYKFNDLYINSNLPNTEIIDNGVTEIPIIYNRIFNEIEGIVDISDNIGLPYPITFRPNSELNIDPGTKLYLHDTTISFLRPFSGNPNEYGKMNIINDLEIIGFDDESEDKFFVANAVVNIGNELELDNCNMYVEYSTIINMDLNAQIGVTNGSELIIYPNSAINFNESVINLENGGMLVTISGAEFHITNNSELYLKDNLSEIQFGSNSKLIINSGATLRLAGDVTIPDGSQIVLETGANLVIENNVSITGNLVISESTNISVLDNSILNLNGYYDYDFKAGSIVNLGVYSKLSLTDEAYLFLDKKVVFNAQSGSLIFIDKFCLLESLLEPDYNEITEDNFIEFNGNWKGIVCEADSKIKLIRARIRGAECAVSGTPDMIMEIGTGYPCHIEQCEITECDNGISLTESDRYFIKSNVLTGKGVGTGVAFTISDGTFRENDIQNFDIGARFVLSPTKVVKNNISNNDKYGIIVSGHNAVPSLVNYEKFEDYNNTIANNGAVSHYPDPFPYAQIGIIPFGNVYMANGMNNIYSGTLNTTPSIPCVSVAGLLPAPPGIPIEPLVHHELIKANNNYWGAESINSNFFKMLSVQNEYYNVGYAIDYSDPAPNPFTVGTQNNIPSETETTLLSNAFRMEDKGNYTASIKLYEHIIDKYEDSPEFYVAMARLPYVYLQDGREVESLVRMYDDALESDNITKKKFFKEMKISTKIKGKKYDEAIALAELMKEEAQSEEEILIADIDIAVANMMKNSNRKSKSGTDYTTVLNGLFAKLHGSEEDGEKTDIVESALPTEFTLYQNYPNPFNPATQIKFALPNASEVKLNVYNINGQLVSELVNGSKEAGIHSVNFDASNYNSGMYFYTLEANGISITKKMILTK